MIEVRFFTTLRNGTGIITQFRPASLHVSGISSSSLKCLRRKRPISFRSNADIL